MQNKKAYEHSHHRFTGVTRHSPRNGFTAYLVLFPVIGLCCHRRQRGTSRSLDASVEASEPHDFVVRFRAVRQQPISVHRVPLRVRDDRERPSVEQDGAGSKDVSTKMETEIFLQMGLDRQRTKQPVGQITNSVFEPAYSKMQR
jgi:hypothetical protein